MMVGDKFVATKNVLGFLSEGDNVVVTDICDDYIYFIFSKNSFEGKGHMTSNEFNEYFKKVEEPVKENNEIENYVTFELVEAIIEESEINAQTVGTCTVVSCTIPSGFVIVETSACANPEEYSEEVGVDICLDKIAEKIFELETYRLMANMYEIAVNEHYCDSCCDSCNGCPFEDDECENNFECETHDFINNPCNIKH